MSDNRDFIYTIPQTVLLDLTLTLVDLRVYAIVRSFMDTTGDAYPSNGWLSAKLGVEKETISRSITKLVAKGHLRRFEDELGYRHLQVGKRVPELLVSQQGVDLKIKGGCDLDQPPLDLKINQLDQSILIQNNNSRCGISFNQLEERLHNLNIFMPITTLAKCTTKYGLDYVASKIDLLEEQLSVENPAKWLMSAIKHDYKDTRPTGTGLPKRAAPENVGFEAEYVEIDPEIAAAGAKQLEELKAMLEGYSLPGYN